MKAEASGVKEAFAARLRKLVESSQFTYTTLDDLRRRFGFNTVVHVFDVPRLLKILDVGYEVVRDLLNTARLRESIERVGVLTPITVAYSPQLKALVVLDGGTRIEAINPSTPVNWRIVDIDVTDEFELAVALAYALNTMLNKFSMEAVAGLYRRFRGVFAKFHLSSRDVLGFYISEVGRGTRLNNAFSQARAIVVNAPGDVAKRALKVLAILEDGLRGNRSGEARRLRGLVSQVEEPAAFLADLALAIAGETMCYRHRGSAGLPIKAIQYAKEVIKQYLAEKPTEEDWVKLLARGLDYAARASACRERIKDAAGDKAEVALQLFEQYLREVRSFRKSTDIVTIAAYATVKALLQDKSMPVEETVGKVAEVFGIPFGSLLSTYRFLNKKLTAGQTPQPPSPGGGGGGA